MGNIVARGPLGRGPVSRWPTGAVRGPRPEPKGWGSRRRRLLLTVALAIVVASPLAGIAWSGVLARASATHAGGGFGSATARPGVEATGLGAPPHPFAIPTTTPPPYAGHFYAGTVYGAATRNVSSLAVTLAIPDDFPQGPPDFYYVLLSAWDTAGSYDQIGFTDDQGIWGLAYSTTTECAGTYHYDPGAMELTRGTTYRFGMSIASGTVSFEADQNASGTWSPVFTLAQVTGGATFEIARTFSCNGTAYYDLTDYEEVYETTGPVPPYDLFFTNNTADGLPVTAWETFTDLSPGGVSVLPNGANTTVANEPYVLTFGPPGDAEAAPETDPPTTAHANLTVTDLTPDAPISVSTYALPTGWTLTFHPGQGSPPFTTLVNFSFPATTPLGPALIGFNATDGSGSYARVALLVNVVSSLLVTVAADSVAIDLGQSVTFHAAATHGTGPYHYNWTSLPPGCTNSGAASDACTPSSAGTFSVVARASDSGGASAQGSTSFTVYEDPVVPAPGASPSTVDVGQSVTFTATPTLGSGGFRYSWSGLPPGCSGTAATVTCQPAGAVTNTSVVVTVTDSVGVNATSPALRFTVFAVPAVTPPAPSRPSADVGQSVTFTSSVVDPGSGQDTLVWSILPPAGLGCPGGSGVALNCAPVLAGTYTVGISISDSNGGASAAFAAFNVSEDVTIASFLGSPAGPRLGNELTLNVTTQGGALPLSYRYSGLPAGCATVDAPVLDCRPSSAGTFVVQVTITDANQFAVEGNVTVTVRPPPASLVPLEEELGLAAGLVAAAAAAGIAIARLVRGRR